MAKLNRSTSARSRSNSAKIDRPFEPVLLDRARRIAEQYRIILRHEGGEYYGQALELPGAMNDGKTPDECLENTFDIVTTTIATMLERGEIPPLPTSDERRDEQVNVRLSKLEKLTFEEAAKSRGFRGLSDFMRAATMSSVAPNK
jgi:predicted RNase H-like HicB family nuclease